MILGELPRDFVKNAKHLFLGFSHGKTAQGVPVKADLLEALERLLAQVREHAALHDAEERIGVLKPVKLILRALRPAQAHAHRGAGFRLRSRTVADFVGRAFVKLHHDVGIERVLNLHRDLGRKEELVAVDGARELHAFFGDLAQLTETEDLKAARVRENRLIPLHEAVKPPVRADDFEARTKPEVEGIPKNCLRAHFLQFIRSHGLHGAVCPDRHEHRRFDGTVIERQRTPAGFPAGRLDFEAECHE